MPDTQITAVYCPHEDYQGDTPLLSWPRVAGLEIRLTKSSGTTSSPQTNLSPTDSDGVTSCPAVAGTYNVAVLNTPPLWRLATGTLTITPKQDPRHVILVPAHDRQFVPLELSYYDPAKGSGPLPGVTVTVVEDSGARHPFTSDAHGRIIAVASLGQVSLELPDTKDLVPPMDTVNLPVRETKNPKPRPIEYAP